MTEVYILMETNPSGVSFPLAVFSKKKDAQKSTKHGPGYDQYVLEFKLHREEIKCNG